MKTIKNVFIIITLLIAFSCNSQTPEQKKQIEEAQKQAEEANKKAMEMMKNNPQYKEALKMMEQGKQKIKDDDEKKKKEKEERAERAKNHMEKFYWRNKVASDTNGKFANWKWGDVNIGYYDGDKRKDKEGNYIDKKYVILGSINSSGVVTMDLHTNVKTNRIISNGLFPQMYDERNEDVTFSKPNTPYLWTNFTLEVIKGGKQLGSLYIGNSERTTHNVVQPNVMGKYGDEGYLLYWAYSGGACSAKASKTQKDVSFPVGENNVKFDKFVTIDLNFKTGWNLIKISVDESTEQAGQKWATKKSYTTVSGMPSDAKYYFNFK